MRALRPAAAAAAGLAALSLSACVTVGPDYRRPELPLPPAYAEDAAPGAVPTIPDDWWTLFGDPRLDELVAEALSANQDLAAAAARVEEARAILGITDADRYPQVNLSADASRTRLSRETSLAPPDFELERDSYRAVADVSYEVDFWGRLRRASEAARAELLASEEGRRNVRLSLVAELVTAYFDLITREDQLAITRATLETRLETARLQQLRFDAGTISGLDLAQAQAEVAAAEAAVPVLERQLRQTENRLTVLLGRIGGRVETGTTLEGLASPEVPVGLPSQLLARRPDVLAAEQRLVAANARIGVARAAYFPAISLTGFAGTESAELTGLLTSGTGVWGAALSLFEPIFNAGRTRRQVAAAAAQERQALAGYTRTVQQAFADVEDALVARRTGITEREALTRQVEALAEARRLSDLRYEEGDSSFLDVLDAQRTLFRVQLELARARRDELAATVLLFQALGGGWEEAGEAEPAADAEAAAGEPGA